MPIHRSGSGRGIGLRRKWGQADRVAARVAVADIAVHGSMTSTQTSQLGRQNAAVVAPTSEPSPGYL